MQVATYDKVDPIAGSFRARLGSDLTLTDGSFFGLVSLNASGRVVAGAGGVTGPVGVLVKNVVRQPVGPLQSPPGIVGSNFMQAKAGDVVDIMQLGEIAVDKTAFPAGTLVYAAANGAISTTAGAGKYLIGFTIEAGRLRINVRVGITAAA